MTYTNEEIARAAGLPWPVAEDETDAGEAYGIYPDWPNDAGAVATHLLPVLEARVPDIIFDRDPDYEDGPWSSTWSGAREPVLVATWHAAVIEAVMQTRGGYNTSRAVNLTSHPQRTY